MAVFNRVAVIALSLVVMAAAALLAVRPENVANAAQMVGDGLRSYTPWSVAWAGAGVFALALLVIVLEVWPRRQSSEFLAKVSGADVVYQPEAVASAVEKELAGLDGIRFTTVQANGRGRSVDLYLGLVTEPGQDTQEVATRAIAKARDTIERGLGLKLARSRLSIQSAEASRSPAVTEARRAEDEEAKILRSA